MMKKLICLTLAALMITGLACAEIATVETTIPLTQADSPGYHHPDLRQRSGSRL